jgi:hypothetical protein
VPDSQALLAQDADYQLPDRFKYMAIIPLPCGFDDTRIGMESAR